MTVAFIRLFVARCEADTGTALPIGHDRFYPLPVQWVQGFFTGNKASDE